jgi:hypothetical protein
MGYALSTCPSGQRVLERRRGRLNFSSKKLSHCARDKSAQNVTDHNAPHTTCRLTQRSKLTNADGDLDNVWNLSSGQVLRGGMQQ